MDGTDVIAIDQTAKATVVTVPVIVKVVARRGNRGERGRPGEPGPQGNRGEPGVIGAIGGKIVYQQSWNNVAADVPLFSLFTPSASKIYFAVGDLWVTTADGGNGNDVVLTLTSNQNGLAIATFTPSVALAALNSFADSNAYGGDATGPFTLKILNSGGPGGYTTTRYSAWVMIWEIG